MPTTVRRTVGTSTASTRISWARLSWTMARGMRNSRTVSLRRGLRSLALVRGLGLFGGLHVVADVVGNPVQVPDQPHRGEAPEDVVGEVDLPPAEALARRHLVV